MNTATQHPVAPEEIMALLDAELTRAETRAVLQHLEECSACASIEEQLRSASQALAAWSVPPVPSNLNEKVEQRAQEIVSAQRAEKPPARGSSKRNPWAFARGGALVAVAAILLVGLAVTFRSQPKHLRQQVAFEDTFAPPTPDSARAAPAPPPMASANGDLANQKAEKPEIAPEPPGPMIARSVSLTILVKNVADSRAALDAILEANHGYAAQLNLSTPEEGSRSFQASLRIPATELAGTLDSLRRLGRVETESQSGEEVTQQHVDLAARLSNARETEQQLRTILLQRAGKMEDVLQVEEQISETRGQIESMEAEQQALEHRVAFATVDLQLTEEYKAQLGGGTSASVGSRMRNAAVTGLRNAGDSLVGLAVFAEEVGPAMLVWIAILGIPAALLWRRYQRAIGKV
ncbi:MAG: DUF4349 domain-containing protein [Acidobacteriaceae bacterium]